MEQTDKPTSTDSRQPSQANRPIPLDYARPEKPKRREYSYITLSMIAELFAIAAVFSLEFKLVVLLFPAPLLVIAASRHAMILSPATWDALFCIVSVMQYPIYGFALDFAKYRGRLATGWIIVKCLHLALIVAAVIVYRSWIW